ncbi:MAG TPA: hypothetical protein VLV54_13725 [Thermoanaerobaculia bacterium]|nr:hypothetical protein [Thermoanaerobaculia bacterium]
MPSDSPPPPSDSSIATLSDPRVAEMLQKVRSGVRQRRAESATLAAGGMETRNGLLMLKSREYVQEPVVFSHRPRWGRLIVFARKAFFHAFLKWYLRPLLEQQNGFNQAASRLIEDLVEAHDRTLRELALVSARLEALEERLVEPASTEDTDGSGE